jgi:hypothetical protein
VCRSTESWVTGISIIKVGAALLASYSDALRVFSY